MKNIFLILLPMLIVYSSCQRKIYNYQMPENSNLPIIEFDTTFFIEKTFQFYGMGDVIYGRPVMMISPAEKLTKKNYYNYKKETINIIFSSLAYVPYNSMKRSLCNVYGKEGTIDSMFVDDKTASLELSEDPRFVLIKKKMKITCFKIGYDPTYKIVNPKNDRMMKAERVLLYGVCDVKAYN